MVDQKAARDIEAVFIDEMFQSGGPEDDDFDCPDRGSRNRIPEWSRHREGRWRPDGRKTASGSSPLLIRICARSRYLPANVRPATGPPLAPCWASAEVVLPAFRRLARVFTVPASRFTSIEKDTMQITQLLAASLLLISASQIQAQGPGAGQPTGGVGPGTSNGRTDGNPTPTGPGTDRPMDDKSMNDKKKKDKRAGTQGGDKPNDKPNMGPGMAPQGPAGSPGGGTPPMP